MDANKRELNLHGNSQHSVNIAGDQNVVHFHSGTGDLSPEPSFRLYNVPDEPPNFIPRPEILDSLKKRILRLEGNAVAITSARKIGVHGMGGIGKTVLAAVLARDESVQKHFSDGIYWIVLGQTPDIVSRQKQLAHAISRKSEDFIDIHVGKARIGELLSDRSCLVVLDDVWEMNHAAAFNALGSGSQLLITTRNANIITGLGADGYSLDLQTPEQARNLLSAWSGMSQLPPQADEIIRECGFLPLAVSMVGAMLKDKPSDRWQSILKRLKEAKLQKIGFKIRGYDYPDLFAAMHVSVEALKPELRKQYSDFAIFPEDTPIPSAVVQRLWESYGAEPEDVEDDTDLLVSLSLLKRDDKNRLTLHDLQRDYLRFQAKAQMPQLHHKLTKALKPVPESGEIRSYYYEHLCYHLHGAGRHEELRQLLLDFRWLEAKLDACDVNLLIQDFRFLPDDNVLNLIRQTIELSAHILSKYASQLTSQLHGRLCSQSSDEIKNFLSRVTPDYCWLRPLTCTLSPPGGALLRTLEGHSKSVEAVAITPDGKRLVSASSDNTIKIWDFQTGKIIKTFEGHSNSIRSVAITPDGKYAVSGSMDNTLRVWDLITGQNIQTLEGHSEAIDCVAITSDSKYVVFGSRDNTLKVWDLNTASLVGKSFEGHIESVWSVALSHDNKYVISGSLDNTLIIWDLDTGQAIRTLEGHSNRVVSVAITPNDKYIVSGSWDNSIKIWDLNTGQAIRTLEGRSVLAITSDNEYVVSADRNSTLKVWDFNTGQCIQTFEGHSGYVNSADIAPDGNYLISASNDNTLKIWNLKTNQTLKYLEGDSSSVYSLAMTPNGNYVVSGGGKELKIWDLKTYKHIRTLNGHSHEILSVTITPNSYYAVSASLDNTMKVWNLKNGKVVRTFKGSNYHSVVITPDGKYIVSTGKTTLQIYNLKTSQAIRKLEGHSKWIDSMAITPDGKYVVSASRDDSLRIWDLYTGKDIQIIEGLSREIHSIAIMPDSRCAMLASNKIIELWDLHTGKKIKIFEGHNGEVNSVVITPDGKTAVSASDDKMLRVWDLQNYKTIVTYYADAELQSCCISPDAKTIVAGDRAGKVHFLRFENVKTES